MCAGGASATGATPTMNSLAARLEACGLLNLAAEARRLEVLAADLRAEADLWFLASEIRRRVRPSGGTLPAMGARRWTREEVSAAEQAAWDAALRYAATLADRQGPPPPHADLWDAGWADACGIVAALLRQEAEHPGSTACLRDAREARP